MRRFLALALACSLCSSFAIAQTGRGKQEGRPGQGLRVGGFGAGGARGGGAGASGPGTPGSSTLQRAGLKLGQPLPNLTIFDEQGGEFRLADLKGKYSVIVFGCLT